MTDALIVEGVSVSYATEEGPLYALRDLSLHAPNASILGVVGESGCGKSTLISSILQLLPDNATITGGAIRVGDRDVLAASQSEL